MLGLCGAWAGGESESSNRARIARPLTALEPAIVPPLGTSHEDMTKMGRFTKVVKADPKDRGNYFPCLPMKYRVRVLRAKAIDVREGSLAFVVECEVLEHLAGDVNAVDSRGKPVPKIGECRDWFVDLSKDAGPGDMQKFISVVTGEDLKALAASGTDGEAEAESVCEWAVDETDNPLAGTEITLETWNRPTRSGGDFTIHDWSDAAPNF